MTDHDELVRKYHTPREALSPEMRARVEEGYRELEKLREEGQFVSEEQAARHDFPIGLDKNYKPYPVNKGTENPDDASGKDSPKP